MAQNNYFTYNIIDTIYFDQPTGKKLTELYGIEESFNRRNPIEYNNMTPEDQADYDNQEQRFIQAVINKYMIDDYGGKTITDSENQSEIIMNGSYISIDTDHRNQYPNLSNNEDIVYAFLQSKREKGIELSDMISNINGTHNYKLMSAKDIDYDNVILPNSAITSEYNWAGFDPNRRWGDKPIHINNTFELLNVIDYLLCACDNLWNELYKIKYSVNERVNIWFTKDVTSNKLIGINYQLVAQDFQPYSDRTNETKMITYLDPTNYYTSLNNNINNKFGIVTNFYKIDGDLDNLSFDRKIMETTGKNIVLMVILPSNKTIENHISTISQNIDGTLQQIYAYQIGDELKVYPGARIDAFINSNNIKTNPNEIIDFKLKTFKNETYFKSNSSGNIYSKLYIKFLNKSKISINQQTEIQNPYFIYYVDSITGKKIIIAYNYQNGSNETEPEIKRIIDRYIRNKNLSTYEFYDFTNNALEDQVVPKQNDESEAIPKFYIIPDEFYSTLEVATPNSKKFASTSKSIKIYYYKRQNNLSCKLTRLGKDDEIIEILPENDPIQSDSLTYNDFRYNIPDNQDITFTFDSSYIAYIRPNLSDDIDPNNYEEGNPFRLKLDDEYKDIMLYKTEEVDNDEKASQYYELQRDVDSSNSYKRKFNQFTYDTFRSSQNNYTATDSTSHLYKHTWMKYDNPYQLCLDIDNDEFIQQSFQYNLVNDEIAYIKSHNEFVLSSYNSYTFNHILKNDIEELKMNLRFYINETSKVKYTECIIPLNINKIYNPTINYYSRNAVELENANYSDKYYTYDFGVKQISLTEIYDKSFSKYNSRFAGLNNIPNLVSYIYDNNQDIETLEDLQKQQTYDCTINNTIFEFTYNYNLNTINLLGSWYTEQYLNKKRIGGTPETHLKYENNNNIITLKSEISTDPQYSYHLYFFNLNGFNKNYRLHGNNNTVPGNINTGGDEDFKKTIYNDFDLLSVASEKSHQSIEEQLKFKLDDDDYQLKYICTELDESSHEIWEENIHDLEDENEEFYSGYGKKENNLYSYIIKTLPINIYKTSYTVKCKKNYSSDDTFTYYLPISYISINSSTFSPLKDTKPEGLIPDINNDEERFKYYQYMNCWDDESNYHPITLSMKLFDNTIKPSPYYYESNEAKMKFNIKRRRADGGISIQGMTSTWVFVSRNSDYYLSDFIEMTPRDVSSISGMTPTGSYFYFNDKYNDHIPGEIFANTYVSELGDVHNKHYLAGLTYVDIRQDIGLQFPDYSLSNINKKVPYPIFNKEIEDSNPIEYDETNKDYDIYRLADINKLKITNVDTGSRKIVIGSIINNQNGEYIVEDANNISEIPGLEGNVNGISTNTSYYILNIGGEEFKNNFTININDQNSQTRFPLIKYHLEHNGVHGSKNYGGQSLPNTSDTNTIICPIIRQSNENLFPQIYSKIQYNNKDYEFFEFKYNNIYEVKKVNDDYQIISINPGAIYGNDNHKLSCKEAYDIQLKLFLNSTSTHFIYNEDTYNG